MGPPASTRGNKTFAKINGLLGSKIMSRNIVWDRQSEMCWVLSLSPPTPPTAPGSGPGQAEAAHCWLWAALAPLRLRWSRYLAPAWSQFIITGPTVTSHRINWFRVLQINSLCWHSLPWDLFLSTMFEVPNKQIWDKIKLRNLKNTVLGNSNRTSRTIPISPLTNLQDSPMHQWAGNFKYESTHAPPGSRLAAHI